MTWQHYTDNWKTLKSDLRQHAGIEILGVPAQTMLESIKARVFGAGATTDGAQMQSYSTTGRSFSRKDFADKSAFTAGKGKSMYLPNGYKQLRQIQGKETGYINLDYTGSFKDAFKTQSSGNNVKLILSTRKAGRLRVIHERRFGPVLNASEMERDALTVTIKGTVDTKTIETLTA